MLAPPHRQLPYSVICTLPFHNPSTAKVSTTKDLVIVLNTMLGAGDNFVGAANKGPRCYACRQNFRRFDMSVCRTQPHMQIRCSGAPHSQQTLSWRCPTHGWPSLPVTIQTSYACYSCHNSCRQGTKLLTCGAQNCTNLARAAKRWSRYMAPPEQQHHRNIIQQRRGSRSSYDTQVELTIARICGNMFLQLIVS